MSATVNLFHTGGFSLFCQFLFLCVISSIISKPNQIYGIICHCFVRGLISLFRWIYQSLTKPFFAPISNGNRTEWSPIRSVIIRVINKIGRSRSGSPICLITSMITDRTGRHKVLLPISHNFNKMCDIIDYFLNQNTRNSKFCFASSEKKSHLSTRVMARTVQLLRHDAYCPIKLSN